MALAWKTSITVAAIVEQQGQFLVVEEITPDGIRFNQPAGHLEQGESLLEAVTRETLEETGHHFAPEWVTEICLWAHSPEQSFLRVCFTGKVSKQDSSVQLDQEIIRPHWMTHAQLIERTDQLRSPLVLSCIDNYLAGHRYPLDILNTL